MFTKSLIFCDGIERLKAAVLPNVASEYRAFCLVIGCPPRDVRLRSYWRPSNLLGNRNRAKFVRRLRAKLSPDPLPCRGSIASDGVRLHNFEV